MKIRGIALLTALMVAAGLVSCGADPPKTSDESEEVSSETEEETVPDETEEQEETAADGSEATLQSCHRTFENEEKPEITMVTLTAYCRGNLKREACVDDAYNNVLHRGVVGLIGMPFYLDLSSEVSGAVLSFTYDKDQLRGVPEDNLMVLYYNEDSDTYDEVPGLSLDKEKCQVSADADASGVYLVVDAYTWLSVWGDSRADKYAYDSDPTAFPTDWERSCDTGSIMELADKQWAVDNFPVFHVSNAEQLASAVYWLNGINCSGDIVLDADIDLTGCDWVPIGWQSAGNTAFTGKIDGGGHKITGLSIQSSDSDVGFIGYGLGCEMKDITFENADVSGRTCVGIAGGEIYGSDHWENVHTSGKIIASGDDYGGVIGREAGMEFVDCSADVEINGEKSEYLSYRLKVIDETEVVETFHLTLNDDHTITRDDHDGFRNLGWHIELNGKTVLDRSAVDFYTEEPELTLDTEYQWIGGSSGKHTVYLTAYINGQYIRVSNIIEYEL